MLKSTGKLGKDTAADNLKKQIQKLLPLAKKLVIKDEHKKIQKLILLLNDAKDNWPVGGTQNANYIAKLNRAKALVEKDFTEQELYKPELINDLKTGVTKVSDDAGKIIPMRTKALNDKLIAFSIKMESLNGDHPGSDMNNKLDTGVDDALELVRNQIDTKKLDSKVQEAKELVSKLQNKTGLKDERKLQILREASKIAMVLKAKAFYWAEAYIPSSPWKRHVRLAMANFSNTASEYSNQLSSRSDVLYKQYDGMDRKDLPLSDHLRDSSPTDFLNLYVWNRAVNIAPFPDLAYHPFSSLNSEGTADRVRAIERLFADNYWSKINTVYASGQGEFGTALIKDDLGNWNLKSFDNDPTELLKAYGQLTRAGIKSAIKLVGKGAAQGVAPGSEQALELASRLAGGRIGSGNQTSGGPNVGQFRANTIRRLQDLKSDTVKNEEVRLNGNVSTAEASVKSAENSAATARINSGKSERKAGLYPYTPIMPPQKTDDPGTSISQANTDAKYAIDKAIESNVKAESIDNNHDAEEVRKTAKRAMEYAADATNEALAASNDEVKAAKAENLGVAAKNRAILALALANQYDEQAKRNKANKELQDFRKKIEQEARGILKGYEDVIKVLQQAAVPST